ncbi:MAG: hypothetical protein ABI068_13805 [Ktedonobacterales bacterium]
MSPTTSSLGAPGGVWKSASGASFSSPNLPIGGGGGSCPNGTSNYSPSSWNCIEIVYDLYQDPAWIRYGQSGVAGFGYLHFYQDHALDLGVVEDVIETNYGIY